MRLSTRRLALPESGGQYRREKPGPAVAGQAARTIPLRTQSLEGSDGVQIEHIDWAPSPGDGVNIAFSNALDGSSPPPAHARNWRHPPPQRM
ncbi:hypothetical protein [Streptomyces canarius]